MSQDPAVELASRLWRQWRDVTRFMESTRIAFARERQIWNSLEISSPHDVRLSAPAGIGTYQVALRDHLDVIETEDMLLASVLIHTYAIAEAAASERLGSDARSVGGIEAWGGKLLALAGNDWGAVLDGRAGVVEAAVVRDAFAHGTDTLDATAAGRLSTEGIPAAAGDRIALDYEYVKRLRDRLRSLLRVGGFNLPEALRNPS